MIRSRLQLFPLRWRKGLIAASAGACAGLVSLGALAQVTTIPAGASLVAPPGSATPAADTTWTLGGAGIYLPSQITLPSGGYLGIAGSGNTLTLHDGAATNYGQFLGPNSPGGPFTLNLSAITLTGGDRSGISPVSEAVGGAIRNLGASTINASGAVEFSGNTGYSGGAISLTGALLVEGAAGSVITFSGNQAAGGGIGSVGGAIDGGVDGITIHGGAITFADNQSAGRSGAIYTGSDVTLGNADGSTSAVRVTGNVASSGAGGAIQAMPGNSLPDKGLITIKGGVVDVSDNAASSSGGALWTNGMNSATVPSIIAVVIDGDTITLNGNTSGSWGGAIYSTGGVTIGNAGATVELSNNQSRLGGGAIDASGRYGTLDDNVKVTIDGGSIDISNNSASDANAFGGALDILGTVLIGHGNSALTLAGNSAAYGGAIASGGAMTLTGHGQITGNTASTDYGGALLAFGDLTLTASGGDMTFSGNKANGQPNAIWLESGDPSTGDPASPAAKAVLNTAGGNIVFFDPIASGFYNGLISVTAPGPGAVIFDGAQWSAIYGATTVQGGTFAVRNGAGYGLLAADAGQSDPSSFTVASGATLAGGASGNVRADNFTLGGTLNIAGNSASASAFTIDSGNVNLAGNVQVKTYAGGQADTLTVNLNGGALAGQTTVNITDASGLGGPTSGDGILVVKVTGAAATLPANTFSSPSVTHGGYAYALLQGQTAGNENNWYLRASPLPPAALAAIPTLGEWALALLALLLAGGAAMRMRRKTA